MTNPTDDNLIRLMLQPPRTGADDPLVIASKLVQRKFDRWRASPAYKAEADEIIYRDEAQLVIDFDAE